MTTVGKGRGWGRYTEEPVLRRPGPPPGPRDELIERVRGIDINDVVSIRESTSLAAEIVPDRENLVNITKLYNEALEDRNFIPNLLAIFYNPSNHCAALMTLLQPDYEGREEFSKKSPSRFLNFVSLMGEVLQRHTMFLPTRLMFNLFAKAVLNLCEMLLESSEEDEIEVVLKQIWYNGCGISEPHPRDLAALINQIKGVLISKNLSTRSRAMLLLTIEIAHNNYPLSLKIDIQKFYETHLKETINELISHRKYVKSMSYGENFVPKIPEFKIPEKQSPPTFTPNPDKGKKPEEKEPQKHPQANQARPRAIRGSGVAGSRDEEKKNPTKSNWTDEKKGWGHDDRFERDY